MPPLEKPLNQQSIDIPARKAIYAAQTEVLVIGGGPAGIGAAIGAANAGAKVILTERYGYFGGNTTVSLVMPMMSAYTHSPPLHPEKAMFLFPNDEGTGKPVVAGVFKKLVDELVKEKGAVPPSVETGYVVPFDPEILKSVAMDMLDTAGVKYLLHSWACDVITKSESRQVIFETKSGTIAIEAKVIIDCTGDGDIAACAGADYEIGRRPDGLVQPMSYLFRMVEFEKERFAQYTREHPDQWHGVYGLYDLIEKAEKDGDLQLPREDILFFATPHEHEVSVNSTRITKVLGTDVWDLTFTESEGRKQVRQITAFLNKYVPGFEKAYNVQSGNSISVRETRRITGEYNLTEDDILSARKFDDMIACGTYPIDIHNPEGKGTILKNVPYGKSYSIPLRCLIPKKIDQVLMAGRCISGTHEAHSSFRITPISMATGQAAGVCAALAVKMHKKVRDVHASVVQEELLRQGAILEK